MPATETDKFSRQEQRLEKARYARIESENKQLRERIEKLEARSAQSDTERRKAERYSKLNELSRVFTLDPAKELSRTEKFNDEQFEEHLDCIAENYSRIPVGQRLYVPPEIDADRYAKKDGGGRANADEARRATELAMKYQREGKAVAFDECLREVRGVAKETTSRAV